jgi:hypothetical protein
MKDEPWEQLRREAWGRFGITEFRPGQAEIMARVLARKIRSGFCHCDNCRDEETSNRRLIGQMAAAAP